MNFEDIWLLPHHFGVEGASMLSVCSSRHLSLAVVPLSSCVVIGIGFSASRQGFHFNSKPKPREAGVAVELIAEENNTYDNLDKKNISQGNTLGLSQYLRKSQVTTTP